MEKVYGIRPNQRHYTCVVDMLSRAGRLREADEFVESMPCEPEANTWSALLSGCRTYGDEERAMGRCGEHERRDEPEGDQEEWGLQLDGAEKYSASVLFTGWKS
ncbi:hypothetical protein SASPL_149595 [Salvia splendens]|uniref:Pentatricopeptide repeat-containing protein n=1 Tax=Salvia splendens TaxID=180675 RepID=A0A8X8WCI5_SALSN|nr:hypothetical protein SASPL_149595 [Salvia splendens]